MVQILELSHKDFKKIIVINTLRALMGKKQKISINNVSVEMETLKRTPKEMVEGLQRAYRDVNRTSHTEMQREKQNEKDKHIQELWDNFKRYNIHIIGIPEREKREHRRNI